MKTNKILTALLPTLAVLVTACSSDNEQMTDFRVPITLTASTLSLTETRSAADVGLNTDYIESEQAVKVRIRNTGSSGDWADYAYTTGTGGTLTPPTIPPFYPLDNTNVDIVAYSPYDATGTFTVRADQTTDDAYLASDLLFASKTNVEKNTAAVPLQFEHKMAKVIVNVTASSVSGVSEVRSITLQNVKRQVTFNETNGTVSNAVTSGATSVTVSKEGTAIVSSGAAVIPAQTIEGDLLTVLTDIGTATYSVSSKTFNAGKVYVLNIYVGRTAIGATTQITGWTDTQSATVSSQDDSFRSFVLHDSRGSYSFTMVKVKGGTFNTFGGYTVSGEVSDFYIGQTEVTSGLWWMMFGNYPSGYSYNSSYPVVGIGFNEVTGANGFMERLNAKLAGQTDGMTFKLPSEIQWEYAAHGGKNHESYIYAGSDALGDVATYQSGTTAELTSCSLHYANSLGLFDMTGNAWEMCSDWDWAVSNNMVIPKDYAGPASGTNHRIRGGGANCTINSINLHVSNRYIWNAADPFLGFRLVLQ